MEFSKTTTGCTLLHPPRFVDDRGAFVKTLQTTMFRELRNQGAIGDIDYPEQFISWSHPGVVRGLHFQTPPAAQDKIVFCLAGEMFDVVVDIRKGSPTYGQHEIFHLSDENAVGVYIPKGFAHGFAVPRDTDAPMTIASYFVSHEYAPEHDDGIRWNTAGIDWPVTDPILSARDASFAALKDYDSPFSFEDNQ